MRNLYVVFGAPGTGKSTWLRKHGFADHSLSLDAFRALVAPRTYASDGQQVYSIRNRINRTVLDAFNAAIEMRMRDGETLFIETTKPANAHAAIKRAPALGYTVTYVDAQHGKDRERVIADQEARTGVDYVPRHDIERLWTSVESASTNLRTRTTNPARVLDADAATAMLIRTENTLVTQHWDSTCSRVVMLSDVQSCSNALRSAITTLDMLDERTRVVFAGDAFDRGPDPVGTMRLMLSLISRQGTVMIEGNHDSHLRSAMHGEQVPEDAVITHRALRSHFRERTINTFLRSLTPAVAFTFAGREWLVTHGGLCAPLVDSLRIPAGYDLLDVSTETLIRGTSRRTMAYRGVTEYDTAVFATMEHPVVHQAFGHRNGDRSQDPAPLRTDGHVFPLEARVENGGHLRAIELCADGSIHTHEFVQ